MNALEKALVLRNSPTDIRNFRDLYIREYKDGSKIKFDSPLIKGIQRYLQLLKEGSEIIQMEKRYYMRPEYVSYDYYGTTNLSFVIMYVNNCSSILDFVMPEILVPSAEDISFVLSKSQRFKQVRNLEVK